MGRGLRLRLGGGGARGFLQPASERGGPHTRARSGGGSGLALNLPPGILPGSVSCTPFHPPRSGYASHLGPRSRGCVEQGRP